MSQSSFTIAKKHTGISQCVACNSAVSTTQGTLINCSLDFDY